MDTHRTDATALLDNRGYSGPLLRGQNPATLIETGLRDRITESLYWKEQCFALNEATLCDRAAELTYYGGTYGDVGKPTPFLCLLFKLLQLQPPKEIILEYLHFTGEQEPTDQKTDAGGPAGDLLAHRKGSFKYLRALAAFYIRLAWEPVEIYTTLEPLLLDYRKLRRRTRTGFTLAHIDSFVDDLLSKDRVCGTALWKLPSRVLLEELDKLDPRESPLAAELESGSASENEMEGIEPARESVPSRRPSSSTSPSRSRSPQTDSLRPADIASQVKGTGPSQPEPALKGAPARKPNEAANEEATRTARAVGPSKATTNYRATHYTDFAPDICKDYRQTGFCGFGDSCKFLHIREDYKQGWALDRDWEVNQKKKKEGAEKPDGAEEEKGPREVAEDGTPLVGGEKTKCFICKSDYVSPVVTKCDHYFCERCVLSRKSTKCAVCKVETNGMFTTVNKKGRRKPGAFKSG